MFYYGRSNCLYATLVGAYFDPVLFATKMNDICVKLYLGYSALFP